MTEASWEDRWECGRCYRPLGRGEGRVICGGCGANEWRERKPTPTPGGAFVPASWGEGTELHKGGVVTSYDDIPAITIRQFKDHERLNRKCIAIMTLLGILIGFYIGRLVP